MTVRTLLGAAAVTTLLAATPSSAHVVGGTTVPAGKYPFLVSLQDGTFHFCGGSVISSTWVLTAKHCVAGIGSPPPASFTVLIGTVNLGSGGVRHRVTEIRRHPDGNSDVALLRLTTATTAAPIRVADAADDTFEAAGTRLIVAGWGSTNPIPISGTNTAREVDVPALSDAQCATTTQSPGSAANRYVCAGGEALKDSCNGDSGGPLFASPPAGRVLIGAVSYGPIPCGTPTQPGVYAEANNAGIRSWISTNAGV